MSSPAQLAANIANAQHSTGPRTEEGKAASSKNATKSGLFSTRDYIRPGEESIYAELCESVRRELAPEGELESMLADEIRRAMWRLRRCAETEATMIETCIAAVNGTDAPVPDPLQIEATAKLQFAVDRARAQCHRLIHRGTAELRKLQTERIFRHQEIGAKADLSFMGLAELRVVRKSMDESNTGVLRKHKITVIESDAAFARAVGSALETNATKQTRDAEPISRNSRCACGSGLKYKRCCAMKMAA